MKDIRSWFKWLFVILPLHGVEQFLFGIDELYELQSQAGAVVGLFPNRDYGIVFMAFLVVYLVMLIIYGSLVGGRWRLLGPGFIGVPAVIESHHIIKTLLHGYFPGAVTAVPFVFVGVMILRGVWRELQSGKTAVAIDAATVSSTS